MSGHSSDDAATVRDGALVGTFHVLTLLLAGIHLLLGLFVAPVPSTRGVQFVVIGLAFLAGFLAHFTHFWHPALYLGAAIFAFYLGALWVLDGFHYPTLGLLTGVVALPFVVIATYLFLRGETRPREGDDASGDPD